MSEFCEDNENINNFGEENDVNELQPAGKRWDPLGAASTEENNDGLSEFGELYQM